MNCHACPYQLEIDVLRKRCLACNPESDAGTPHHRVKANDFTLNVVQKAEDYSRIPSGQATNLSADDEHKLRIAMSTLFGLDPIDLLLVQHLMRGGSLESFGNAIRKVANRVAGYRGSSRAMAWARKEKIIRVFPQFEAVIKTNYAFDAANRVSSVLK